MTDDVFPATTATNADSGVSTIYAARGVKQKRRQPKGSSIKMPSSAAFLRGLRIISRHSWISRLSSIPRIFRFQCMNRGIGNKASRRKRSFDALLRKSIAIFARVMRRGWATRFPVIAEILVLSDERTAPKSVAPSGSFS